MIPNGAALHRTFLEVTIDVTQRWRLSTAANAGEYVIH
jgi:hypothetical protein